MARAEQFNFYVNPETEAELYNWLKDFPKMIRSNHIKSVLNVARMGSNPPASVGYPVAPPAPIKPLETDNVIRYSGEYLDIDIDDL